MNKRTGMTQTVAVVLAHQINQDMHDTRTHVTDHGNYDVQSQRVGTQGQAATQFQVVIYRDPVGKTDPGDHVGPARGVVAVFTSVKEYRDWEGLRGMSLLAEGKLEVLR